jgi:3-hydroxybutyryl-CoA dehydrogenase
MSAASHTTDTIHTVGVVGAGQMGSGIAQVMACDGQRHVIVSDVTDDVLASSKRRIEDSLAKLVSKGKLTDDQAAQALSRLRFSTNQNDLASCDLVVEAIVEDEAVKNRLFQALDSLLPAKAIIASNTSSISITRLAAITSRPSQVIGMHFMNPVPLMALVELIRGAQTSDATYQAIYGLSLALGKTPVCSQDFPGFISNRILMPLLNEAIFALYEGVGTADDIDTVMKLGMNHPMGPLTLADFIGLDTVLAILNVLHQGFGDPRYRPCPLLKQYVDAGYLGRKSRRGFYTYP